MVFVTDEQTVEQAGPDYQATIELVQSGLTEEVMQELSARVDIDQEDAGAGRRRLPDQSRLHRVATNPPCARLERARGGAAPSGRLRCARR